MSKDKPHQLIFRMGSHSEKEYLTKTGRFLDGLIVGANLLEATPGATMSLLLKLAGEKYGVRYYVDPMSYVFGVYTDPKSGERREDLDWIKSNRKVKDKTVWGIKRSYTALAERYGGPFEAAIERGRAVDVSDFRNATNGKKICQSVIDYQLTRIRLELIKDKELVEFAEDAPDPAAVFAPYFYIEPGNKQALSELAIKTAAWSVEVAPKNIPVHAVICADRSALADSTLTDRLVTELPKTGISGVWLWFSRFFEADADVADLKAFRRLVENLSGHLLVYNMHGGFFSLALEKLTGVSHGIGYGEQKDVHPVIGQSTPSVRYYLPDIRKRLGVPKIELCFRALGIETPKDFFDKVCDCVICKGVIEKISDFSAFGEMRYSRVESQRMAQTPAAAKRCRYHFILNRIRERDWIRSATKNEVISAIKDAERKWNLVPMTSEMTHLAKWREVLSAE
ncbi:MAG: hypothetical protein QOF62_2592 [Pyrinomonadaceae bacterium]|nr:hypothetical protein [Pyrinomonadaceae bacterium]